MQELDLEKIRQEIDKVDQQLADVLESRLHLVMQVAAYKKSKGLPVKDKNREAKVIEKVAGFLENKEYSVAVKNIMRGIIDQPVCWKKLRCPKQTTKPMRLLASVLQAPLRIRLWRNIFMDAATIVITSRPLKK